VQDLIARLDLLLWSKDQPGLTTRSPEEPPHTPETSDPTDPATEYPTPDGGFALSRLHYIL
jgi:hypothetical protein